MALDDVDKVNGCMEVALGSHKWGILGENDYRGPDLEAQSRGSRRAASASTMDHGSRANRSNSEKEKKLLYSTWHQGSSYLWLVTACDV